MSSCHGFLRCSRLLLLFEAPPRGLDCCLAEGEGMPVLFTLQFPRDNVAGSGVPVACSDRWSGLLVGESVASFKLPHTASEPALVGLASGFS